MTVRHDWANQALPAATRVWLAEMEDQAGSQALRRALYAGRAEKAMFDLVTEAAPTVGALTGTQSLAKSWYALTNPGAGNAAVDPNAPFDYAGAAGMQVSPSSNFFIGPSVPSYNVRSGGNGVGMPMTVRAMFDGLNLNIGFKNYNGYQVRLWVNGREVTNAGFALTGTPATAYLPLTFAARGPHLIEFMLPVPFFGFFTDASDTVWLPSAPAFRIWLSGDSYAGGTGATQVTDYAHKLSDYLNTRDIFVDGEGGTGYTIPGTAPNLKLRDSLELDLPKVTPTPDLIVLAAGHNDSAGAALQSEVAASVASARRICPNAFVVVVGPLAKDAASSYTTIQAQMFAAAVGADLLVDTLAPSPGWLYGTGRVGATAGNGNDDFYIFTDNIHPSPAGHDYIGRRLAQAITRAALRAA